MTRALYAVPVAREEPPRYRQIADDLRARIEAGEFPPGSRLPTKAELMAAYRVALTTVNNAIGVLRDMGLAETHQGRGMYARKPPEPGPSEYDRMMARLDQVDETVRRLEERLAAVEQERRQ
jgi:DNA-binding GntR family transcriptional regulator